MINSERVTIPVGDGVTSGILTTPKDGGRTAVIVAHGAGNDMDTAFLGAFSDGLALGGYPVLRFNFLYSDRGRKSPDRKEALFAAWQGAYQFVRKTIDPDSLVAAGKSMGGRIAAEMTAEGLLPADRLIFLGYPLHPADDREKLRDASLYRIRVPMLFFAGTRDPLCRLDKLQPVLKNLRTPWDLYTIEGGDHSFHVPKSSGRTEEDIYRLVVEKTLEWLSSVPR